MRGWLLLVVALLIAGCASDPVKDAAPARGPDFQINGGFPLGTTSPVWTATIDEQNGAEYAWTLTFGDGAVIRGNRSTTTVEHLFPYPGRFEASFHVEGIPDASQFHTFVSTPVGFSVVPGVETPAGCTNTSDLLGTSPPISFDASIGGHWTYHAAPSGSLVSGMTLEWFAGDDLIQSTMNLTGPVPVGATWARLCEPLPTRGEAILSLLPPDWPTYST